MEMMELDIPDNFCWVVYEVQGVSKQIQPFIMIIIYFRRQA